MKSDLSSQRTTIFFFTFSKFVRNRKSTKVIKFIDIHGQTKKVREKAKMLARNKNVQ